MVITNRTSADERLSRIQTENPLGPPNIEADSSAAIHNINTFLRFVLPGCGEQLSGAAATRPSYYAPTYNVEEEC
jgi:hypothetical protein